MKKPVVTEESVLVEPEVAFDIDSMKVPVVVVVNTPKLEKEYQRISNKLGTAFAEVLNTADLAIHA
jgi:hypothetical protein